jgi:hypothetical protein
VLEAEAAWLQSLSARERARFLIRLCLNLTVAGRALALSGATTEARLERLRELNEIQHRVMGYASHAVGATEDQSFLLPLVMTVLREPRDPDLINAARYAWGQARTHFDPP